jgi:hypothetical protein
MGEAQRPALVESHVSDFQRDAHLSDASADPDDLFIVVGIKHYDGPNLFQETYVAHLVEQDFRATVSRLLETSFKYASIEIAALMQRQELAKWAAERQVQLTLNPPAAPPLVLA